MNTPEEIIPNTIKEEPLINDVYDSISSLGLSQNIINLTKHTEGDTILKILARGNGYQYINNDNYEEFIEVAVSLSLFNNNIIFTIKTIYEQLMKTTEILLNDDIITDAIKFALLPSPNKHVNLNNIASILILAIITHRDA